MSQAIWTDDDVDTLLSMRDQGATCTEIGRALGRSGDSVEKKLARMRKPRLLSHSLNDSFNEAAIRKASNRFGAGVPLRDRNEGVTSL